MTPLDSIVPTVAATPTPPDRELPINDPPPSDGSQPPVQDPPVQHPDPAIRQQSEQARGDEPSLEGDWADDVNPEAHESAV